jgi:hypothetical protein
MMHVRGNVSSLPAARTGLADVLRTALLSGIFRDSNVFDGNRLTG